MPTPSELRFCWWNVQDFAHSDPVRSAVDRWPYSEDEYAEKMRRVIAAFNTLFLGDDPELIGLGEITPAAAGRLRQQRFPEHELVLTQPADPHEFQIVLLIHPRANLARCPSWVVRDVSDDTRPMGVVKWATPTASVLFVVCHWPAFEKPTSREGRRECAKQFRVTVFEYLYPDDSTACRNVVAFGDFNTEPHDPLFVETLFASRDRERARQRRHYRDRAKRWVRMYNCGWRLTGEEHPHELQESAVRRVGTYYRAKDHEWRTYDQVLVTGGLLSGRTPYLDEGALRVRTDTGNLIEGKPAKFRYVKGAGSGLSDHYPLSGRIVLAEEAGNVRS